MQSRYKNYQQIYTDGSKEDSKVGCDVISDNNSNMQRIPDDSSIFTAPWRVPTTLSRSLGHTSHRGRY